MGIIVRGLADATGKLGNVNPNAPNEPYHALDREEFLARLGEGCR